MRIDLKSAAPRSKWPRDDPLATHRSDAVRIAFFLLEVAPSGIPSQRSAAHAGRATRRPARHRDGTRAGGHGRRRRRGGARRARARGDQPDVVARGRVARGVL